MSIRHFPHVQGQWVTHVCLEIEIDHKYLVVPEGFKPLFGDDQKLHVSLSPLFSLKHFQVKAFKKSCENLAKSLSRQCIMFEGGVYLIDSSKTSTFYALTIKDKDSIKDIKLKFDKVIDLYKPKFLETFENEIIHMSIARSQDIYENEAPKHNPIIGICTKLVCTIGGEKTQFFLDA